MYKKIITAFLFCFSFFSSVGQTTDLSILVVAQNTTGIDVSQVQIFQDFQYVVTIINSGNTVANATFSQTINSNVSVTSFISQNNLGGATPASALIINTNVLTGTIANLPTNSSVEIKVLVTAPTTLGGIATNATVTPPSGTQDTSPTNNQSIISIDVVDVVIDFTVTQAQITPPEGSGISMWNDTVTYEFTITNQSSITYPLSNFMGVFELNSSLDYGQPIVQMLSIECLGGTNGTFCPDVSSVTSSPIIISSSQPVFSFGNPHEFTSGGSLSFQVVYKFLQPLCAIEQQPIGVKSYIKLNLNHPNVSSNNSNQINLNLLTAELCQLTDVCIETIQLNPAVTDLVNWEEEVTFVTTVCNNGPLDATIRFFLQNLSVNVVWEIVSLTCTGTTGNIGCDDFTLTQQNMVWTSNEFLMPANATITVETVAKFLEPECSTGSTNTIAHVRSGINLLSSQIIDININNNAESDYVTLPPSATCASSDLNVTKTQIAPILPIGSSSASTANWGNVTYEITVSNPSDNDTFIALSDFMPQNFNQFVTASLVSVECMATTGSASCHAIDHANIGVELDGVAQSGILDVFWEILPEDNWSLPAQSSVTFQVIVNWSPECTTQNIKATNAVSISHSGSVIDSNNDNNTALVNTYFAPCVDLIVQTFPQFTQVSVNQNFEWIIDITNSNTSSNAIDILFTDTLGPEFFITGPPTCQITSGTATCISAFNISSNSITGVIPNMEAASTVRIRIPVSAPSYGGAFSNTAEATPSVANNEELTPETNISISNVQVIAPTLVKSFDPDQMMPGEESVLTFTITNISSNPFQNNINFTDNLPSGLLLSGAPNWVNDNGCTATFVGNIGDAFVGVTNLTFPSGISSCTFSVGITSDVAGEYINNSENFSNRNNIDVSQASAALLVVGDDSDVDIEVLKNVMPTIASLGDEVQFVISITNLGTTQASGIDIFERLPNGYQYLNASSTNGIYNVSTFLWSVAQLNPNESATLTIDALVISSNDLLNVAALENLNETDRNDSNNEDTAEIELTNCLKVPQGISPNADGLNDLLVIPCIENYQNNTLKIFNRLGVQIYEASNYLNNWDGIPNMGIPKMSTRLPVGTYFYILEAEGLPNLTGWIYLNY